MIRKIPLLAMATLFAGAVTLQAGSIQDGTLTRFSIVKTLGDIVFIKTNKSKDGPPACHTNLGWDFVMPLSSEQDKKLYAMLLTARAQQTPVTLSGSGTCEYFGSIETLIGIHW